jgi:hypothetical protein
MSPGVWRAQRHQPAIRSLVRTWTVELGNRKILCQIDQSRHHRYADRDRLAQGAIRQIVATIPRGRWGTAEEFAPGGGLCRRPGSINSRATV